MTLLKEHPKKKTETMSFRIDGDVLEKLREEAEKQEISLNILANKIFTRYVEWNMFEPRVGMVPVARPILNALFQKLTEDETIELAKKIGKNVVSDIAHFMKGSMDMDSFISWFETRMNMSTFEMNHKVDDNVHSYVIKHDLGYNWSLYHKTVLELIFMEIFKKPIRIQINERMIMLSFSSYE